jgi:hypothetical protein
MSEIVFCGVPCDAHGVTRENAASIADAFGGELVIKIKGREVRVGDFLVDHPAGVVCLTSEEVEQFK